MRVVTRGSWGMPGNLGPPKVGPFEGVDLHHTAALDVDGGDPIRDLRSACSYTSRKFGRVSYNAGIDLDDLDALLQMQWRRIGAHNDGENSTRFGLVIAGNFQQQAAPDALVVAIADTVRLLHDEGIIRTMHIKGHRDTDRTACPGSNLYARLGDVRALIEEDPVADWRYDGPAQEMFDAGIFSEHTQPGTTVDTDALSAFLSRLLREVDRRIEQSGAGDGMNEAAVTDVARRVADARISAHAGDPDAHHE